MLGGKKNKTPLHGWLVLDKPLGLTSTQAIGKARRLLGGNKVGHGGTLDPLATGILPLAFGEATKLIPYVMDGDKVYEFTVRWGEQRSTDDAEGDVIATSEARPTEAAIRAALPVFTGWIDQLPPMFSAIKLDGERAYDIARAGGTPDIAPRKVMIYDIQILNASQPHQTSFKVASGKGMYVRSLARDLALHLGTRGYVSALRRTQVGPFGPAQAVTLAKLENLAAQGDAKTALLPLTAVMEGKPMLDLLPADAQKLRLGQGVLIRPDQMSMMDEPAVIALSQNVPVAIVAPKAGEWRVVRGFHF